MAQRKRCGRPERQVIVNGSSSDVGTGRYRLAVHDLVALDAASGVARIYHQLCFVDDLLVVVVGVVGDDEHAIVLAEIVERRTLHLQVVLAAAADEGKIRVVVADGRAFFLQQLDNRERGRLAQVVNIFLVGDAENQNLRSVDRLLLAIERGNGRRDHVVGHGHVDLAGQFDEAGAEVEFLRLP